LTKILQKDFICFTAKKLPLFTPIFLFYFFANICEENLLGMKAGAWRLV